MNARLNAQEHSPGTFIPTVDSAQAAVYVRNNKFVIAYPDGGGIGYRWMDLTGTSTTWTHSTMAP